MGNGAGGLQPRRYRLEYFDHEQARSRAYRWNYDGLGGICDEEQHLCMALALWNGRDPILKERLFDLTGKMGNRGEDVKEYYFYLDATPSHSYLQYLYEYPQSEYPFAELVEENRRRTRSDPPYSLLDTGVLEENRYWDVYVVYAKIRTGQYPPSSYRPQPWPEEGDSPPVADSLVSQYLVLGGDAAGRLRRVTVRPILGALCSLIQSDCESF